jgi:gamma-glutamylcysteine synthetase
MDWLSAVVSLTIQLVGSVREMRRAVSDAPKELERLIDLLKQLERALEDTAAIVERQQKRTAPTDIDVSARVLQAVMTCKSKLKPLEDVVDIAKKSTAMTNKASRTLGRSDWLARIRISRDLRASCMTLSTC